MKGITPVIAVILLLLITISMVGFAFVWFSRVAQTATEQTEKQLQTDLDRQGKKVAIDNIGSGSVTLRNIGTSNIAAGDLKLYVNNTAQAACDAVSIAAGGTSTCNLNPPCGDGGTMKVTSPGNQDQITC